MGIRANAAANYASQIYIAVIGFALVPIYIRYMGPEAYGLVGLFVAIQAWFQLLDLGLSPTLSREIARRRGTEELRGSARSLLNLLSKPFILVSAVGCLFLLASAEFIATAWLNIQTITAYEATICIALMAPTIAMRFMSGLYRGAISGCEEFIWLSTANAAIASMRFVLIIPAFHVLGTTPITFFSFQLIVSIVEVTTLSRKTYSLLPSTTTPVKLRRDELRSTLRFAGGMWLSGLIWVAATQLDKLILAGLLPLSDYAYYTAAALLASAIVIAAGPIGTTLLPRLAALHAQGSEVAYLGLYRRATQLLVCLVAPAAAILITQPTLVLLVWSGDENFSAAAADVLALYAAGYVFVSLSTLPFYLQSALGKLRLHIVGNCAFVAIFVPLLAWQTTIHGMRGAAISWLLCNALYFILWVPYIHKTMAPGIHLSWVKSDILLLSAPSLLTAAGFLALPTPASRSSAALSLMALASLSYVTTFLVWKASRQWLFSGWRFLFRTL